MTWTDKAEEISNAIMSELKKQNNNVYTAAQVERALKKAAIKGMQHECENFVLQRR